MPRPTMCLLLALLTFMPAFVTADTPPIPDLPENQAEIAAVARGETVLADDPMPTAPTAVSAMMTDINAAIAAQATQRAELEKRLAAAADTDAALAVIRQIEQAKQAGEIEILRIQVRYAEQAGRLEQVRELQDATGLMTRGADDDGSGR